MLIKTENKKGINQYINPQIHFTSSFLHTIDSIKYKRYMKQAIYTFT